MLKRLQRELRRREKQKNRLSPQHLREREREFNLDRFSSLPVPSVGGGVVGVVRGTQTGLPSVHVLNES